MQNTVFIIGNGKIRRDIASDVESAARVIRFNGMPNRGGWSGYRTDDLWLCSTGRPGRRFADMDCLRFLVNESGARRVFTSASPASLSRNIASRLCLQHHRINHATNIQRLARLLGVDTGFPEPRSDRKLHQLLLKHGRPTASFKGASTGIIAIHHYVFNPVDTQQEIVLAGFDFGGWRGHDWDRERLLVEEFAAAGQVRFIR